MLLRFVPLLLLLTPSHPLPPAHSPDGGSTASAAVDRRFVTSAGADYTLLINDHPAYPKKKHHLFSGYTDIHTFLSEFVWSPDSQHVAFVEKTFDWEYGDPYNRDFSGFTTRQRFWLAVVSRSGQALGYKLPNSPSRINLEWLDAKELSLDGRVFNLQTGPPSAIP